MQRNCRFVISIFTLIVFSLSAFAQDKVEYKDVFLDGKPAKLNVATGEVTLVNLKDKKTTKTEETIEKSKSSSVSAVNSNDFHVVKENETLLDISKKYSVSLTQLKQANNLESTLVNKGQKLRVNNFNAVIETAFQPENTDIESSNSESSNFHIVSKGETLFSLAKRYSLTVNELKRLNNLDSNLIITNQKLRIDGFAKSEDLNNASIWIVRKGDNLYRIALNNGTTVEALKRLNGLTSNMIKIGQKLQLR